MREINFLKQEDFSSLACTPDESGHCITCSDDAKSAEVLRVDPAMYSALVQVDGAESEVDISLLDEVSPGDFLLIHGGVALSNQATGS